MSGQSHGESHGDSPDSWTDEQRVCVIHGLICALHRYIRAGKSTSAISALERLAEMVPVTSTQIVYGLRRAGWDVINACWLISPDVVAAYADGTRLDAEASGQAPADAASDAGWVIALGLETMQTSYPSPRPSPRETFNALETALGEGLSNGVTITFIDRTGPTLMHQMYSDIYTRSLHAQPPALAEFHRLKSIPGTDDQKIDRLAASSGRESVAALVVSCLHGSPASCQSRIMRVLAVGNIRPADALAIIVALMHYPRILLAPDFLNEVATVLAEQFVTGIHRKSPTGLSQLFLPPVIV
jgi:hypothetical protein